MSDSARLLLRCWHFVRGWEESPYTYGRSADALLVEYETRARHLAVGIIGWGC